MEGRGAVGGEGRIKEGRRVENVVGKGNGGGEGCVADVGGWRGGAGLVRRSFAFPWRHYGFVGGGHGNKSECNYRRWLGVELDRVRRLASARLLEGFKVG